MTLKITRPQSVSDHKPQQERHGARWAVLSPSAHRSNVNVKEARASALGEAECVEGGAEVVGGHLKRIHDAGDLVGQKIIADDFKVGAPFGEPVLADGAVKKPNGKSASFNGDADAFPRADNRLPDCNNFGVCGGEASPYRAHAGKLLIGNVANFGHFILQRAMAPFRMTMNIADILSGCQALSARAA